ncbi:peroxidase isoform X2 [Eurosta solidaginis]
MVWKVNAFHTFTLLVTISFAFGLTKVSSSTYHIVRNDQLIPHAFKFQMGQPQPSILLSSGPKRNVAFDKSPDPSNPFSQFNSAYGAQFPIGGVAICAMSPGKCDKSPYRTMDGSCNHKDNPQAGMANSRYGRLLSPKYGDGISTPTRSVTGAELPNARLISLIVFGELDVPDPQFTLMNMQWGQIMTHDMSMQAGGTQARKHPTRCCTETGSLISSGKTHSTCYPIIVPPNDPAYSQVGTECLDFVRTLTDRDIKCLYENGPAEQLTAVTAYADLSLVYGNSIQQNSEIRAFQGGRMLVDDRTGAEYLPPSRNSTADCDAAPPGEVCYQAGDIRVNQNPGLAILHTILLREHNRIADSLVKFNPHYNDRTLFQEARKINIAQYQHISYYEWLPMFLGSENMQKNRLIYKTDNNFINDFDSSIDPSILNEHATAAFRYFHSQIEGRLDLVSELRSILGSLRLSDWMNRPSIIEIGDNFDSLTRGHATQPEELTDINFDREIKHFLLRRNRPFGSDLRAIDIQRNRDHGLASYNDMREFCGLGRASSWDDYRDLIDGYIIEKMKTLYSGYEDVDLTVGGAVEAHVAGALAGPTFLCILTEQFYRTRVGDRFWYENGDTLTGFTEGQLAELRKISMARLLCDNGNQISSMQPQAFKTVSKSNPIVPCENIPQVDLTKWIDQKPVLQG